jgi:hypothetical protein
VVVADGARLDARTNFVPVLVVVVGDGASLHLVLVFMDLSFSWSE